MTDDDVKPGNIIRFWPAASGDHVVLAAAVYVPSHSFSWPLSELRRCADRDVGFKVLPSDGSVA